MIDFLKYLISPGTLALVFGGLLTTIFALFAALLKGERIPKWIIWGSCVAGLIVLAAGVYSGFEGQQMASSLQHKSEKIAALSNKIVELEEQNVELSKKIADSITGGGSYLKITPFIPVKSNMIQFLLWNRGDHPLYDVYENLKLEYPVPWTEMKSFPAEGRDKCAMYCT